MTTKLIVIDYATSCVDIREVPPNLMNKDINSDELVEQMGYNSNQVSYMIATQELGLNIQVGGIESKTTID